MFSVRPMFATKSEFWKGKFSFPPTEVLSPTQVIAKVNVQGMWELDVRDVIVATVTSTPPICPIVRVKKTKLALFVRDAKGVDTGIPKQYVVEMAFDSTIYQIVAIPTIVPCTFRGDELGVVAYYALSEKNVTVVIGFNPRRFSFGGTFECVNLIDYNAGKDGEQSTSSAAYSYSGTDHRGDVEWVKSLNKDEASLKRAWKQLVGREYIPGDMEYEEHCAASLALEDLITEAVGKNESVGPDVEDSSDSEVEVILSKTEPKFKPAGFEDMVVQVEEVELKPIEWKFKDVKDLLNQPSRPEDEEDKYSFQACVNQGERAKRLQLMGD
jgi:hypothetical protein